VIEIQSEPDLIDVVHHFDEFTIIKHFIERIRSRNILNDKLISVRTKKVCEGFNLILYLSQLYEEQILCSKINLN